MHTLHCLYWLGNRASFTSLFTCTGKIALINYLLQTAVGVTIFYLC
ncbi:DUF418 domain-containing protein [Brumicola pallidula]